MFHAAQENTLVCATARVGPTTHLAFCGEDISPIAAMAPALLENNGVYFLPAQWREVQDHLYLVAQQTQEKHLQCSGNPGSSGSVGLDL